MIKLKSINVEKRTTTPDGSTIRICECSLMSDTSDEVIAIGNDGSTVVGLDSTIRIAPFSTCFTKDKELGVLGSDNQWTF